MNKKEISSWEFFSIPNSDIIVTRRMSEDSEEVSAVVFGKEKNWKWMILSESRDIASGSAKSLQLGKFIADLKLSDLTSPLLIKDIFK